MSRAHPPQGRPKAGVGPPTAAMYRHLKAAANATAPAVESTPAAGQPQGGVRPPRGDGAGVAPRDEGGNTRSRGPRAAGDRVVGPFGPDCACAARSAGVRQNSLRAARCAQTAAASMRLEARCARRLPSCAARHPAHRPPADHACRSHPHPRTPKKHPTHPARRAPFLHPAPLPAPPRLTQQIPAHRHAARSTPAAGPPQGGVRPPRGDGAGVAPRDGGGPQSVKRIGMPRSAM